MSQAAPQETEESVLRPSWSRFSRDLREVWEPGEHVSIFAPTGAGKTVLAIRGLLPLREHVLTLDAKGGDPELRRAGRTLPRYPRWWELDSRGENRIRIFTKPERLRAVFADALGSVWDDGGWTLYLDEARLATDYLGLSRPLHKLWLFARSRGVSVVAGTQAPRWVPSAMYDQARHLFIGRVRDRRVVDRLSELASDVDGLRTLIPRLGRFEFLYLGSGPPAVVRFPLKRGGR